MRSVLLAGCVGLMAIVLTACGNSTDVIVTGEVRHKGAIYKPEQGEQVMVSFGETKDGKVSGNTFPTRLGNDGTFKMTGPDNKGIPAGKYRVTITSMPEVPKPGQSPVIKFPEVMDFQKTPLTADVSSSNKNIKLDIP